MQLLNGVRWNFSQHGFVLGKFANAFVELSLKSFISFFPSYLFPYVHSLLQKDDHEYNNLMTWWRCCGIPRVLAVLVREADFFDFSLHCLIRFPNQGFNVQFRWTVSFRTHFLLWWCPDAFYLPFTACRQPLIQTSAYPFDFRSILGKDICSVVNFKLDPVGHPLLQVDRLYE